MKKGLYESIKKKSAKLQQVSQIFRIFVRILSFSLYKGSLGN